MFKIIYNNHKIKNNFFFSILFIFISNCYKQSSEIIPKNETIIIDTLTIKSIESLMVTIPSGNFIMGCNIINTDCYIDELPNFNVFIDSFKISKIEITQRIWLEVMGNNPSYHNGLNNGEELGIDLNRPVENVSWDSIQKFISKLQIITNKKYRLPTEAEWEYVARETGQSNYIYSGTNYIDTVAWYFNNSANTTQRVGLKLPNKLGIYDMTGNVSEWCYDSFQPYNNQTKYNPLFDNGILKIIRGGNYFNNAAYCRISFRDYANKSLTFKDTGFRLAQTIEK